MANEATLHFETHGPIQFAIDEALAVEKGTLLVIIDPMKVSKHSTINQPIAGIAAEEHIASTGKDKIAVYREGIFRMTLSGGTVAGNALVGSATANKVSNSSGATEQFYVGTSFETAANSETLLVELRPYSISQ